MRAETQNVQQLFQDRRQYRVPFYQRAYVWEKEAQWAPLWEDILEKAEYRTNGDEPPPHFLGAIVLEPQARQGLRGVEILNIIDGQQRLTTLQYFLCALRIQIRAIKADALLPLVDGCLSNPNPDTMIQAEIEIFKVWPTFRDRQPYQAVMQAVHFDDLCNAFPEHFTQNLTLRKIGILHPAALEAVCFFYDQISEWLDNDAGETANEKLERLTLSVFRDLRFVSISLKEEEDDAQVIFETLNGRGAELHATDLIRNFIFMRADRDHLDAGELYDTYWTPFESPFWLEDQRRGRFTKPRIEWFFQTTLQARLSDDVEISRLYAGYRRYALSSTSNTAQVQLRTLTTYAEKYRSLVTGLGSDPIAEIGRKIALWDVSTAHPIILRTAIDLDDQSEQRAIYNCLLSYIVRRAICGLTAKSYNKIFSQLLKRMSDNELSWNRIVSELAALEGNASRWPRDDEFRHAWMTNAVHNQLGDLRRIRLILAEIENGIRSSRTEEPFTLSDNLDIDHILPVSWYRHWPLNSEVVSENDARKAKYSILPVDEQSELAKAIVRREGLKMTWGNLTLVHYGINRAAQNDRYESKREMLFAESNLHLNRVLMLADSWSEDQIEKRSQEMFGVVSRVWPGPA